MAGSFCLPKTSHFGRLYRLRDELEIQERRRMERLHALEMEKRQAGDRMNQHMYVPTGGVRSYWSYPESRISKNHN